MQHQAFLTTAVLLNGDYCSNHTMPTCIDLSLLVALLVFKRLQIKFAKVDQTELFDKTEWRHYNINNSSRLCYIPSGLSSSVLKIQFFSHK